MAASESYEQLAARQTYWGSLGPRYGYEPERQKEKEAKMGSSRDHWDDKDDLAPMKKRLGRNQSEDTYRPSTDRDMSEQNEKSPHAGEVSETIGEHFERLVRKVKNTESALTIAHEAATFAYESYNVAQRNHNDSRAALEALTKTFTELKK